MNIFVGNLSFEAKEIDVQRAFMAFGVVTSVAIVMEKKGKKSRGFGFVEMPDEQEALAAIAQLRGKDILGRPINVTPAVSKGPKSEPAGKKNRYSSGVGGSRHDPSFVRTGKYKEGRRSLSYVRKRTDAGITTPVPEKRYKSNPMRWLKKPRTQARFVKPEGELKPWQRPQTESNPWKKPLAKSSSWKKPEGESKPWEKSRGAAKPWIKSASREVKPWEKNRSESKSWIKSASSDAKPWKKAEGESRSWKKTESAAVVRPWKKSASAAKPWRKSSADRQQSGFKKPSRFSKT
ncbi:MAG: RNA recognition motif domain-containing protein [Candidatus Omnitrophota bacterium]